MTTRNVCLSLHYNGANRYLFVNGTEIIKFKAMTFFGTNIIDINNNEPSFYPYSIEVSKCSGSCNNINDPYAKLCVSDVVKNINVKVFNQMSRTNEARHVE